MTALIPGVGGEGEAPAHPGFHLAEGDLAALRAMQGPVVSAVDGACICGDETAPGHHFATPDPDCGVFAHRHATQKEHTMTAPSLDLTTLHLAKGGHEDRGDGLCLLEAAAWWAGEEHSDAPECVSVVLTTYGTRLNDVLPDDRRQELVRFVPLLPGTRGDGLDETRSYLALDWLIRTYTPAFLDLRPELADVAAELRGLRRIVDLAAAQSARPVVLKAREQSAAAWAAAGDAAWAAAGAAAWAAAGAAAGAAAWAAAGDAAWDAAWDAAGDAAGDAARAAARAAAGDAARAAARDAAGDALAPTVTHLQTSAINLYAALIQPAPVTL